MQAFASGRSAQVVHSSLVACLKTMDSAKKNAVLWFGEVMDRKLYLELGYSSMNQYAMKGLGFSKTRTGDFLTLCQRLEKLPAIKQELEDGNLGYTKARVLAGVADEKNQQQWLEAARQKSRQELEREARRARQQAADQAKGQPSLLPEPEKRPAAVVPVRVSFEMSPEQYSRYEAMWEHLYKQGLVTAEKVEVLLEALASYAAQKAPRGALGAAVSASDGNESAPPDERYAEQDNAQGVKGRQEGEPTEKGRPDARRDPRRDLRTKTSTPGSLSVRAPRPPFQIHIHHCPECAKSTVPTSRGELAISEADYERAQCDATISEPGRRNRSTIPPSVKKEVLERDRYQCRTPGCTHSRFLEIHHIVPRSKGGGNDADNLITLCAACHRRVHRRGAGLAGERPLTYRTRAGVVRHETGPRLDEVRMCRSGTKRSVVGQVGREKPEAQNFQ